MTTLNHHREGHGEPLVLVHGVGSRWQVWEPIIGTLAEHFDVIAVDLPGFGDSAPLPRTTVDTLTDALAGFLATQGLDRPHLAGNSMGGGISLNLGARGLARSVTAFSPIFFWDRGGRIWCQKSLGQAKTLGRLLGPAMPKVLATPLGRTLFLGLVFGKPWTVGPQIALDTANGAINSLGFSPALESFTDAKLTDPTALADLPVTIAWGSRDILLTYKTQSRRAREILPRARHITLEGSGHTPFYDDPAACARVILDRLPT
ncbi:alpha/beta hydrolase [Nocardia sp. NPDC019395]|uniref:alpha/beta fold hydrolase n=1 Tax=Nocardia sp. NPDC019395 TaxID=3154686 RepID=UPI0033ECDCDC